MEVKIVASGTLKRRVLDTEPEFFQWIEKLLKEQGFEAVDTLIQTPESHSSPCPRLS
jgi:hypothetical protein